MSKLFQTVGFSVCAAMLGGGVMLATAQPKDGVKNDEPNPAAPADAKTVEGVKVENPTYESADGKETLPVVARSEVKLVIEDLKVGTGAAATLDSTVTILYHGTFADGKVFDSTRTADNQPRSWPLRQLIQGWQIGIPGMKVGGIRRLSVPWQLAYGEKGRGPIPPKADLYFIIELKDVK